MGDVVTREMVPGLADRMSKCKYIHSHRDREDFRQEMALDLMERKIGKPIGSSLKHSSGEALRRVFGANEGCEVRRWRNRSAWDQGAVDEGMCADDTSLGMVDADDSWDAMLSTLRDPHRFIIDAHYRSGLTFRQIAGLMRMKLHQVFRLRREAIGTIQASLHAKGIRNSGDAMAVVGNN